VDQYDAVVIGAGLGGLSAGSLLATQGLSVLVVEQADQPGGYAHSFRRGPYTFDPAIHVTPEVRDGQAVDVLLRHAGVRDSLTFLETTTMVDALLPGLNVRLPIHSDAFLQAHIDHFPDARDQLHKFFWLCAQIHVEAHELPPQIPLSQLDLAAAEFPTLFRYQRSTLADVLDEYFTDQRLKAVLGVTWPYHVLPPSRLSFLSYAQYLAVCSQGLFFCRGGFQSLVDALAAALRSAGGDLVLGVAATGIAVEDGRVIGVRLGDGRRIGTGAVISNAAARQTLLDLVGEEHLPVPYVRRLRKLELSLSDFIAFGVTRADLTALGSPHDSFVFRTWDHEAAYRDILAGRPSVVLVNTPTLVDPTLAPPGEHIVNLVVPAAYDVGRPWAEHGPAFLEETLEIVRSGMPELAESLEIVDTGTPETLERYTKNEQGAMLGWAFTPKQSASGRLSPRTPIEGLLLAGHWTQPGSSAIRVLVSGFFAGQRVLERNGVTPPSLPLAIDVSWSGLHH